MIQDTRYSVAVLTVSDSSSANHLLDKSGPLITDILTTTQKYSICQQAIVPDSTARIQERVLHYIDALGLDLVIITGGTGFAERDTTPEAITSLLTRQTPGITHLLLSSSLSITPFAALSRPITGIRGKSLIITLPGSPKACKENLSAILNVLPHGLDLLRGDSVVNFHGEMQKDSKVPVQPSHQHQHHTCMHRIDIPDHTRHTGRSGELDAPVTRRARSSPYPMITIAEAQGLIALNCHALGNRSCELGEAMVGEILAEDVKAVENVPGYRASVVDGYAVHVEDGPGIYSVALVSLAATSSDTINPLEHHQIARISTGGLVPPGANAIVMVEDTRLIKTSKDGKHEDQVEILVQVLEGENIREIGSDCSSGQVVGHKGQVISHVGGELGLLASVGIKQVLVCQKPRVAILSTGSELKNVLYSGVLQPGEIRDANRITLSSAVISAGFELVDLGIVGDKVEALEQVLHKAFSVADVLITTGGVSMGEADFMKPLLEQKFGAVVHFGRVLMKPGKPTTFATVHQESSHTKPVFALPGNPVSATVAFYLFVLPALRKMSGHPHPENTVLPAKIVQDIHLDGRPEYHRARVSVSTEGIIAESTGDQQSSRMLSLLGANGLLELPAKTEALRVLKKGSLVNCIMLGPLY
ncbi:MoaB/Mog domain-containing protein [Spinellus fusiger]|nr:MoaB/Mog domain-containing protein [Spinellus fusiger]